MQSHSTQSVGVARKKERQMKARKMLTTILLIASLIGASPISWAAHQNDQRFSQKTANLNDQNLQLPRKDIQRFVTAIALIHRYYIKKVTNTKLFNHAISGMVSNLDPHSTYLDANELKDLKTTVSGQFVGVGIELTVTKAGLLKVISPLDGSPAEKAGIKANDIIIKINDKLVRNLSLTEAVRRIKGKKGTQVRLTIIRKNVNKPLTFKLTRQTINLVSVKSKILENGYGYARITFFQGPLEKQLRAAINKLKERSGNKLKGFVLDLRNNPGGLLDVSAQVANTFLDSKKINKYKDYIVYTKGRIPGADIHIKMTPGDIISHTPMVVLINGGSASASEIVAGALQDYKRAIIMGTRSFGKGSVQTVLPLGKDSAIKLTTALYYTPAGREIQAKGIVPNITVPALTVKNSENGFIAIDEADFQNHLANESNNKNNKNAATKLKAMLKSEIQLAKDDYQLYEALTILKGLNAVRH